MKFSDIVKNIRTRSELTQIEFAKKLGVCGILISHYETGHKKRPHLDVAKNLVKLAKQMDYIITMDDIYL